MFVNRFFDDPFSSMHSLERRIARDFDKAFGRHLRPFDYGFMGSDSFFEDPFESIIEPTFRAIREIPRRPSLRDVDENTTYHAKYMINDNGHVWEKTIDKEPGKEWKSHVEEYDLPERKKLLGGEETKQLKDSKIEEEPMKNAEETKSPATKDQGQLKNSPETKSLNSSSKKEKRH